MAAVAAIFGTDMGAAMGTAMGTAMLNIDVINKLYEKIYGIIFLKPIFPRIAQICLKLIEENRNDNNLLVDTKSMEASFASNLENNCISIMKTASKVKSINDMYAKCFENSFLQNAKLFYCQRKSPFESNKMLEYVKMVDKYLEDEIKLAEKYLPDGKSTLKNLIDILEDIFIPDKTLNDIVKNIMSLERKPDKHEKLAMLYKSINRIPKIKNKLSIMKNVYGRLRCLDREPELYDLHTHLLGMGNTGFWINTILANHTIMPTNDEFRRDGDLREKLCRLVWDSKTDGFLAGKKVEKIIKYLIEKEYPNVLLQKLKKFIEKELPSAETVFNSQIIQEENENEFFRELKTRALTFQDFSYDVVLELNDLASGLGENNRNNEFIQAAVEEKLGFHMSSSNPRFRHWIIFNARTQKFKVVYGITVEELRNLINIDANAPRETNKLARAHIANAFSMCDAHGSIARQVDFHGFYGMFTPEFYPRRFALKDSIYSQRLDVLAHLLYYVLLRYDKCHPRVTYCELSVGVGDLTRPWVFDVLCSFRASEQKSVEQFTRKQEGDGLPVRHAKISPDSKNFAEQRSRTRVDSASISFRKLLCTGHFPSLEDSVTKATIFQQQTMSLVPKCTYKFLAGFNRQKVQTSFFTNQKEAINLLNEAPQVAIHLILKEISKSAAAEPIQKGDLFYEHVEQLKELKESAKKNSSFHDWVVGFDLFGDEMGYPYCPFVAQDFIKYVLEVREKFNPSFGLRIHCGENVPFADANTPTYRHFAAHMYIAFRCLRYLQYKLEYGIRIGHGIAFQRILDGTMSTSKHRKSSVLLAEIRNHAQHVFKTIAFEVNITSNEYLLGHALRKGDYQRALQLDALLTLGAPIVLATDDDGIWPIDNCSHGCPSHHSLSAEYCRAICSEIIQDPEVLEKMFQDMKKFRFYSKNSEGNHVVLMPKANIKKLPNDTKASTVIIHPDIIEFIMSRCRDQNQREGKFYEDFAEAYPEKCTETTNNTASSSGKSKSWEQAYPRLAPIAYASYCAENFEHRSESNKKMQDQYKIIFGETSGVLEVLEEWKNVYQQLIKPNIIGQSNCVLTNSGKDVFFSEDPLTVYNDEQWPMKDLINYLKGNYDKHMRVHVFTRHINVQSIVSKIKTELVEPYHSNLHVYIYSNKHKEKYEAVDPSVNIQLEINPNSFKRTNYKKIEQQNGLYAICPHASAATAFLHFVSEELANDVIPQTSTTQTGPSTSNTAENTRFFYTSGTALLQYDDDIRLSALDTNSLLPKVTEDAASNDTTNASSSQNDENILSSELVTPVSYAYTTQVYYHDKDEQLSTDMNDDVNA